MFEVDLSLLYSLQLNTIWNINPAQNCRYLNYEAIFYIFFLIVCKSHVQGETKNELILPTSIVWYIFFFCVLD